ncbi:MAG: VWA domain-containing protein [Actinomycetota bacterium]
MVLRFVLLCVVALAMLGSPQAATAEEDPGGSILVIMDVSGSMARKDAGGTTLIQGARQAVRQLVSEAPPETPVGLRLYGHTYPGEDKRRGCQDTELVVPVEAVAQSGTAITAAIGGVKPTGFTPIGGALKQAVKDFPPEGERTIVLVSDGEDTCGAPEPCQAARQLAGQGIAVQVDTVGLFLQGNAKAQKQLQCVAKATGGRYYTADNAAQLTERLTTVSQRAIQRFEASGGPIQGGPAATRATAMEAGAAYVDNVKPGEARWYSFPAGQGQEVAVTLTEDGSTDYGCCLELALHGPDFDRIDSESTFNGGATAKTMRVASPDRGLDDSGDYYLEVTLDADAANRPVTYEFVAEVSGAALEESPSAEPTPSPTVEPSPTEEPTPAAEEPAEDELESAAADTDEGGGLWTVLIAVLVALVLAAGAAVGLLARSTLRK